MPHCSSPSSSSPVALDRHSDSPIKHHESSPLESYPPASALPLHLLQGGRQAAQRTRHCLRCLLQARLVLLHGMVLGI